MITLLTDFGLTDPYVAEMKSVILTICPAARIVDISHGIRKFDVRMGSFVLAQATPYFPEGTIHAAVVDPGVGTKRRPILIETSRSFYVGPDNGLLMFSANKEGLEQVYEITNPEYMLKNISNTFHGRDIFSPVAAYLAKGVAPSEFGQEIFDPDILSFMKPAFRNDHLEGEVIHIDDFGNLTTNITLADLEKIGVSKQTKSLMVKFAGEEILLTLCSAYGESESKKALAVIGSTGFLEISINQDNASSILQVKTGNKTIIRKSGK